MENDEEKKAAAKQTVIEQQIPRFFGRFNSIKEANGGQWFVGKNVSEWYERFDGYLNSCNT